MDLLIDTILPFLVLLTIVVFFHELGHYLVARWNGVKVEVFSVGFGPELFGWTARSGTRWKVSAIPLGGYIKMFGDANVASQPGEEVREMSPDDKKVSFHYKRLSQRAWIVAAGPLANFVLAIVLLAGLYMTMGQSFTPAVIGEVVPDSAAAEAGFEAGDRIVGINGSSVERFEEVQRVVGMGGGETMTFRVLRDEAEMDLVATPRVIEVTDNFGNTHSVGRLGVSRQGIEYVRHDPFTAAYRAVEETFALTANTLQAVWQFFAGTRSTDELSGPLGIAQMSGAVAEIGIGPFLMFTAILSINLGLINLFPIPILDGGHLLLYGIEAVRGRPLGERVQEYGFRVGLALILALMVFVTWNDLMRLEVLDFIKGLVS